MSNKSSIFSFLFLIVTNPIFTQLPFNLVDARAGKSANILNVLISNKPAEVLFGIDIEDDGEVYFSMNNSMWFDKIFKDNSYGIAVDLVSKDKYACNITSLKSNSKALPKGEIIRPTYLKDLVKNNYALADGKIKVKIGQVPSDLKGKQLEGNLIIVIGNDICYYTNFVNIDRNVWELLPMGLFADTVILNNKTFSDSIQDFFIYSKKFKFEIPFEKGSVSFDKAYLAQFFDAMGIQKYSIKEVEIRAYSSVDGPEKVNKGLMNKRASMVMDALKKYQPNIPRVKIITAENWLDFFKDIEETKYSNFKELSKLEIKQKLTDKSILNDLEPILFKERKAIAEIYIETKSPVASKSENQLLTDFKTAVSNKKTTKAAEIQKEILTRIMDNKLPINYLDKLEVPETKAFSTLLSDREVYKYLLKSTTEYEALEHFLEIQKLDSKNGNINYNICALRFFMWKNGGDSTIQEILLKEILELPRQNIDNALVKRLLINYNILKCEEDMELYNYEDKDTSLYYIRTLYYEIALNDQDIFSLAKYFAYYTHYDWAEEIILPRIDQIDVSEDLVFYFVNLQFYHPDGYGSKKFRKSLLNAINLNPQRFCNFFLPNDNGGASMQLLEYTELKEKYCETCKRE